MSFVLIAIMLFFIILLVIDLSKGIILMTSTVFFLNYLGSGIPGVRLFYLLSIVIIPLFLFHVYIKRDIKLLDNYPRGILYASLFVAACYFITNYYAQNKQTAVIIVNLICYFVYPYIFWHVINTPEKLTRLFKAMIILFAVAVIYTFVEAALGYNPIANYLVESGFNEGLLGDRTSERMGFKRCNSIFESASTLGFLSTSAFFLFFFLRYDYEFPSPKRLLNYTLFLLPVCVFLTGTRSQMVAFLVCLLPLIFYKRHYKIPIFRWYLILAIVTLPFIAEPVSVLANSVINSDTSTEIHGSNAAMRQNQLEISLFYWGRSPVWGNGRMYIWEHVRPDNPDLLGAESIWFSLLVDYGTMGCISFLTLIIACMVDLYRRNKIFLFLPLAFLTAKTLSAVIGIEFYTLIIFSLLLIKIHTFYPVKR
jgi:hypothetical protein